MRTTNCSRATRAPGPNRLHGAVTALLASVLLIPLLGSPWVGARQGIRPVIFEWLALALFGAAMLRTAILRRDAGPSALPASSGRPPEEAPRRTAPPWPVLLFVLYGAASLTWSAAPGFSSAEWIRLASGAALYFAMVLTVRRRSAVKTAVDVLLLVALVTSLGALIDFGQSDSLSASAAFGNKQLLAGFLLLLLPLALALSFSDLGLRYKLLAQGTALLAMAALLLSQNRTSWVGTAVSMLVLGGLAVRQADPGWLIRSRHQLVVPVVIVVGALGLFLLVTRTAPVVSSRATTLAAVRRDPSFAWRLDVWKGAWQLVRQRPWFGWGIGSYPIEQSRSIPGAWPREVVQKTGPTLAEEAHNEYVQVAAELGVVGLGDLHSLRLKIIISQGR